MPRNSIEAAFLYQAELMNRDSRLRGVTHLFANSFGVQAGPRFHG